jgi:hypothetical protein
MSNSTITAVSTQVSSEENQVGLNQSNKNVFKFTDINSTVSGSTFPDKTNLVSILTQEHFNRLLQLIKTKILNASLENLNFIRIHNPETMQFKATTITGVKTFLSGKGYTITDIEDVVGQILGWKLSW